MKNTRMFEVKFIGPTNSRGSRLKITDTRFGKSVILSKSYKYNNITDQAVEFLQSKGIELITRSWNEKTGVDFLMTENFTVQIK